MQTEPHRTKNGEQACSNRIVGHGCQILDVRDCLGARRDERRWQPVRALVGLSGRQ